MRESSDSRSHSRSLGPQGVQSGKESCSPEGTDRKLLPHPVLPHPTPGALHILSRQESIAVECAEPEPILLASSFIINTCKAV